MGDILLRLIKSLFDAMKYPLITIKCLQLNRELRVLKLALELQVLPAWNIFTASSKTKQGDRRKVFYLIANTTAQKLSWL